MRKKKTKKKGKNKNKATKSRWQDKNNKVLNFFYRNRGHIVTLLILIGIGVLLHGVNMFNFPYYENDEGTYLSRGWSLINQGRLDPYTYWYDHVPFASFMIGIWLLLSGGMDTFGMAVNSGRVFMLLLFLTDIVLIYYISWRMTGRKIMGIVASLLLIVSPLSIYFSRRVLLDNMIIFFMLGTLAILIKEKLTIRWILVSAVVFALGVLTKENVVLFMPIYLALIFFRTKGTTRFLSLMNWLIVAGGLISIYFLYAILKKEFFFPGMLGTPEDSVSLLYTLKFHLGRGNGLPFWQEGSDFMGNFTDWLNKDPVVVYVGAVTLIPLIPLAIKNKWARVLLAYSLIHAWFLMRGSLILNFYIMPVLPLIALNTGFVIDWVVEKLDKYLKIPKLFYYVYLLLLITLFFVWSPKDYLTKDENFAYREAVDWVRDNLEGDEIIVSDNAIYIDLHITNQRFPNSEWFWKVDTDPEIYEGKLEEDWKNIDYIFLSHETVKQLASGSFTYIQTALENAEQVESWQDYSTSYVNLDQFISTNGDWGMMYRVPSDAELREDNTWKNIRDNYVYSYGQIYDKSAGKTTSYMQTSAMYMAVLAEDHDAFKGFHAWTRDHFKHRLDDELLSYQWTQKSLEDDGNVTDTSTRSRADIQYVAALLMAYEKWEDEEYLTEARSMLEDIWEVEVIELRGRFYVTSGSGAAIYNPQLNLVDRFLIDPYAGLPEYLDLFMKYDPDRNWEFVKEDWYLQANNILKGNKGNNNLLPEELVLTLDGNLATRKKYQPTALSSTIFSVSNSRRDPVNEMDLELNSNIKLSGFTNEDNSGDLSDQTVISNYLITDNLASFSEDWEQSGSFYQYQYEKGFNYETGEWSGIEDLNKLYLLWALSEKGKNND